MKKMVSLVVAGLMGLSSVTAWAADAPTASQIKVGSQLRTADGRNAGTVDRVVLDESGNAASVSILAETRFIRVPISTISQDGKKLVTSLTKKEVLKLP